MTINYCLFFFMMNIFNSSLMLLNSSKPVMATIALAFSFLNTSFVLIVMNFEFIALIIIIVYIGAIIILFLFTIMLLHIKDDIYLTKQNENVMFYFTFTFLYCFYYIVIVLITIEGSQNLEDFFINKEVNLNNAIHINEFLHQTVATIQDSTYKVENIISDNIITNYLQRDLLIENGYLKHSNLNELINLYEKYDMISKNKLPSPRPVEYLYKGLGQISFSYLELSNRDINTSTFYSLHDFRQYLYALTNINKKAFTSIYLDSGCFGRTDANLANLKFIDYYKNALNNGLLETYNFNPVVQEHYPTKLQNVHHIDWHMSHMLKEAQVNVVDGVYERFNIGYGIDYGSGFYPTNSLIIPQNNIIDFFINFTFLKESNFINNSLNMGSCNKDLELETELHSLGIVLYTIGCVYFILASVILLIALIGSVVLITSDNLEFIEIQQTSNQISKKNIF